MPFLPKSPFAPPCRVGVVGTGFVASVFVRLLLRTAPDLPVTAVLSRRPSAQISSHLMPFYYADQALEDFLAACDLVVECSGDICHATTVIEAALGLGKPVVTMHCEWHVTVGSFFVGKGLLSEAEGDQPGSLAVLREEILAMGFEPRVYGNIKHFLNHQPTPAEMQFWSERQGIRLRQTTSFTDGTKVQFEQALVANGLNADILKPGLRGLVSQNLQVGAAELAEEAQAAQLERVSDYLLAPNLPPGVFITASHDPADQAALAYLKMGPGPWYTLYRPYHLCQYEMVRTVRRMAQGGTPLLNNSAAPRIGIRAIAKRDLVPGEQIDNAIGSFVLRGEAIRLAEYPDHLPMGLIQAASVQRPIEAGDYLRWGDLELPDSRALQVAKQIYFPT